MQNKKGQSLIDVVFSIGILILTLTGVVVLVVSTARVKKVALERQKATELSQRLIEIEIKRMKDDPLAFWNSFQNGEFYESQNKTDADFPDYFYDVKYNCVIAGAANDKCTLDFIVRWGDNQTLSVQRLFTRKGT